MIIVRPVLVFKAENRLHDFDACPPGLLLICYNMSLLQPLTITRTPLVLVNSICLLQELALGKRP